MMKWNTRIFGVAYFNVNHLLIGICVYWWELLLCTDVKKIEWKGLECSKLLGYSGAIKIKMLIVCSEIQCVMSKWAKKIHFFLSMSKKVSTFAPAFER